MLQSVMGIAIAAACDMVPRGNLRLWSFELPSRICILDDLW